MPSPFLATVQAAISQGIDALLRQQDNDGFWREFDLQPGASEAWVTAWVGWCLARAIDDQREREASVRESCRRAAIALWHARRRGGWGYNRETGPDADTTSWVLRFYAACGTRLDPAAYLAPYVDQGGGVHTFREADWGSWTDAHDDVAANAGLALSGTPAAASLVARIERRLVARFPGETFWWSTPTYGTAWTIRFLTACHGALPHASRQTAHDWLNGLLQSNCSFEIAHRLIAALGMEMEAECVLLANQLLNFAVPQGWPGASLLLVPPRDAGEQPAPAPELRGILTTAICVRALSEWLVADAPRNAACGALVYQFS